MSLVHHSVILGLHKRINFLVPLSFVTQSPALPTSQAQQTQRQSKELLAPGAQPRTRLPQVAPRHQPSPAGGRGLSQAGLDCSQWGGAGDPTRMVPQLSSTYYTALGPQPSTLGCLSAEHLGPASCLPFPHFSGSHSRCYL